MFGSSELMEQRERHYRQFFGAVEPRVMHSTDIKPVHVDVYEYPPTAERPFYTLVTGGMSDAPQSFPENRPEGLADRAELLMYVSEPQGWMFNVLKGLAEYPHEAGNCLHWGHTVPNGKPMTAKPSLLTSYLFRKPSAEDAEFSPLYLNGDLVDFLWLVPITEAEREYAVKHGSKSLNQLMDKKRLPRVLDESRISLI